MQAHVRLADASADLCLGQARDSEPMTPDTVVPWLSAGKPLTAVAVGQLWEQGRLSMDDRVADHVPEFGVRGKEAIRVRHLLTHTAGFRSRLDVLPEPQPWAEVLGRACAARQERNWEPGQRAGYQARAGCLLGEIVQRVTGETLAERVHRDVVEAAGLQDTWLAVPPASYDDLARRSAPLFDTSGEQPVIIAALDGEAAAIHCAPGASARGPMRDLSRFYAAMLEVDVVLSPPTTAALTTAHRVGILDESFRHVIDWGLGFGVDSNRYGADTVPYGFGRRCSTRTFGHGGSQCCIGFGDPEHGLAVGLAVTGRAGEERHQARFRRALTALYEDLLIT